MEVECLHSVSVTTEHFEFWSNKENIVSLFAYQLFYFDAKNSPKVH